MSVTSRVKTNEANRGFAGNGAALLAIAITLVSVALYFQYRSLLGYLTYGHSHTTVWALQLDAYAFAFGFCWIRYDAFG